MQISSPTIPNQQDKKYILLVGPPGSRKTTLGLQFPNLEVYDLDQNLKGPETILRKGAPMLKLVPLLPSLTYSYSTIAVKPDGSSRDPAECYDELINQIKTNKSTAQWTMIDGLSAINEYIIQKIMKEQRISYMEARNWSTFKSDAINLLFTQMRKLNRNVIITAHEVRDEHNDPKNMMNKILDGYEPFIQGKVAEMLGGFFTDVWRLEAKMAPGDKVETVLQTDKTGLMKQLKNSCGMPPIIVNPTYEKLKPYLEGTVK